ncbi:MAG TPA: chalcone isomerase family protein [Stellaceae bacterium]|nr:chalcone isomerase family protein [Stellaceae bacterium]
MRLFAAYLAAALVVYVLLFGAHWGEFAPYAWGATCDGANFPDSVKLANTDLVLNGLGVREATIFSVKVYVAGLYLAQKGSNPGQILGANQPWRLELHFVRDVGASDIRDAWQEGFEKSAPDKIAALQARIDVLKAATTDFKVGQSLVFSNDPATGVTVAVNGAAGHSIAGADFATALLGIWLGAKPPNADLKSGLLGGPCE